MQAVHIYSAKKAAIIFQPEDQTAFEAVHKFIKSLQDKGIDVTAVGFINKKKIPNSFLLHKGFIFFCKQDLNWFYKPIADFTESFLKEKFDILIDFSLERNLAVDYLVYLSNAGFKAGKFVEGGHPFDLTIDVSKNNQLNYLIDQLQHYLNFVNKPVTNETA